MNTASAVASAPLIGPLRLAALLIRFRLRYLWNGVRARGRGRFPTLVVVVGLFTSVAYVGLFSQAFAVIVENTDVTGQITALAVVALTIAFGSFTAKAASSEAVLAGSPENEFLLARPVALPTLVVARCLAESATDPLGALFLLPVMLAAVLTWHLPAGALLLAALISVLVQLGVSALAQTAQISVVRFIPRARRRAAWTILRLIASLSLAALWMMGTRVLRAPGELARGLAPLAPLVALSPGALIVGPLGALARGSVAGSAAALVALAVAVGGTVFVAATVARRAGMRGWEEAGATWADAAVRPRAARDAGSGGRILTAATKDLALITRDRSQLLALIAMPVIFVGVQLFGALGWTWSSANLTRVSTLSFSLALYMATIGPLAHMQAERRAFWILRTVPISVGRLFAAKARAWSVLVGGTAAVAFAGLSLGAPIPSLGAWMGWLAIVVLGAVGMTWLAVALAASAADLSDEQRPAIGPATIYTFLLVGGLYNVVVVGDEATRVRGLILYAFAIASYWIDGVQQAVICLDAEAVQQRRLKLADGATLVIALALGQRAAAAAVTLAGETSPLASLIAQLGTVVAVGIMAALILARRPRAVPRMGLPAALTLALGVGLLAGAGARVLGLAGSAAVVAMKMAAQPLNWLVAIPILVGEELLLRGLVQRGIEETLLASRITRRTGLAAGLGALGSVAIAMVAVGGGAGALPPVMVVVMHAAPAAARAATGRLSAAFLARAVALALAITAPAS
jgi:hypothetical protein